jgi:hypothetical protein
MEVKKTDQHFTESWLCEEGHSPEVEIITFLAFFIII